MKQRFMAALAASAALVLAVALGACSAPSQPAPSSNENAASSESGASSTQASSAQPASSTKANSSSTATATNPPKASSRTDAQIIDATLAYFDNLAAIPRQSGNEQQVSNYLFDWAEGRGLNVKQDGANNIIFDVPATDGLDKLPMVGLQAHMDMVCIAAPGIAYNPAVDAIAVVRDDQADTLKADGTSLGADDGIGVAMIMDIVEGNMAHGPLRVFLTTDEEVGMSGVAAIDPDDVAGLPYLINIDGEDADAVIVSSAGGIDVEATGSLDAQDVENDAAATITLSGLRGGHSGFDINEGRCNAIRTLADALEKLADSDTDYGLCTLQGGTAGNAIPSSATATITFNSSDTQKIQDFLAAYEAELVRAYSGIEAGISLKMETVDVPSRVLTSESAGNVLDYAVDVFDGVYSISQVIDDLVESSSNLGVLNASATDGFYALSFIRSSDHGKLDEIQAQQVSTASSCGFDSHAGNYTEMWPYNPDSELSKLCQKVYEKNNKKALEVDAIHAALECGRFVELEPEIDVVSLGPDLAGVHSPDETLTLSSLPRTWRLLEGVLAGIS